MVENCGPIIDPYYIGKCGIKLKVSHVCPSQWIKATVSPILHPPLQLFAENRFTIFAISQCQHRSSPPGPRTAAVSLLMKYIPAKTRSLCGDYELFREIFWRLCLLNDTGSRNVFVGFQFYIILCLSPLCSTAPAPWLQPWSLMWGRTLVIIFHQR